MTVFVENVGFVLLSIVAFMVSTTLSYVGFAALPLLAGHEVVPYLGDWNEILIGVWGIVNFAAFMALMFNVTEFFGRK